MRYNKIVICGQRCVGKTTLMWQLQKQLNWPMFSVSQFLRDYIRTHQVSPFEVEENSQAVTDDIDSRVEALLNSGNQVIVESRVFDKNRSRPEDAMTLLLYASENVRVARSAGREKTSEDKARKRLNKREGEFEARMSQIYGYSSLFDPANYDLAIDTDNLSPQEVLNRVTEAIRG